MARASIEEVRGTLGLARAVLGGLTSSTLITLVFVPVVYSLFDRGEKPRQE